MKKSFIPLTALAMLALISCGGPSNNQNSSVEPEPTTSEAPATSESPASSEAPATSESPASSEAPVSSEEDVVNSITISNKEALQAEWAFGSANRTVNIALDPAGNVNYLISVGKITIVSSNTQVITVSGRVLHAAGAGTATITVAYGDKSDSVEITVVAEKNAIELYGTVHAGTEADPLDNEDAIKVAKATGTTETEKYFYVKGTVASFREAPSSYGNVSYYLEPAEGKTEKFLIFRATLKDGGKVTDDDIWVGAVAVAKVKIVNYNNNILETSSGGEIVSVEGTKPEIHTHEVNVAQAVDACKAMEANSTSTDKYVITGYIAAVTANGFYLKDAKGKITPTQDDFLVYGYSGENKDRCTLNAKVKVTCTIKYYVSTSTEGKYAVETGTIESVEILEAGDAPVVVEKITTAKALEIIAALGDGATSEKEYVVTGYVSEVTSAYSDSYKNMSFTLGEAKDSTELLTVFRAKLASGTASDDIVAGAKVEVSCYLQKYVKDSTTTPEAIKGTVTLLEKAAGTPVSATLSASSIKIGETATITAKAGEGDTFTYESDAEDVATVSSEGVVTGVAAGTASITVTSSSGRKAYVTITVTASNVEQVSNFTGVSGTLGETGYSYKAEKGNASTAPGIYDSAIRVYQNGGLFTVSGKSDSKALVSLAITSDGSSKGEGPFKYVYGASKETVGKETAVEASAWSDHTVTLTFEGTDVRFFRLTTTSTSKNERVYIKALTLTFAE